MSSRPTEHTRGPTALDVSALTIQLAAAATDGIPIAKQVLGVASRIISLAEDIEKRRDALYQLAETARVMGQNIQAVVSDRKFSGEIVQSLDGLLGVLRSIETLLDKHKARSGFRRALGYAFTTAKHVDTLSQELSRATLQFQLVAALDSNARLTEANASLQKANECVEEINVRVQNDAQYIGEVGGQYEQIYDELSLLKFRRIRQGDVESPELIAEHRICLTSYSSRIYSAKVNGSVCILRCFVRSTEVERERQSYWDKQLLQEVVEHDKLLEEISMFQISHRNIARLHGRSSGEHFDRFNIINLGCIPISEAPQCTATVDGTWNVVRQILDALCHLDEKGVTWNPDIFMPIFVDGTGAPIIGLHNDLHPSDERLYRFQISVLGNLLEQCLKASWQESYPDADEHHHPAISTVSRTVANPFFTRRRLIPLGIILGLNEKISGYLQKALASCTDNETVWMNTGAVVLRAATFGPTMGSAFYTIYWAAPVGRDRLSMHRVEESDDELIHLETDVNVPIDMKDVFRKTLGITLPVPADLKKFISTYDPAEPSSMSFRPAPW